MKVSSNVRQGAESSDQRQQRRAGSPGRSCSRPASSGGPTRRAARRSRARLRGGPTWHRRAGWPDRRRRRRTRQPRPLPGPACAVGRKMPGVSTRSTCDSARIRMPRTRNRVVWAFGETIESFAPVSRFISVDLPAFGAPTIATKPHRAGGGRLIETAERGGLPRPVVPPPGWLPAVPLAADDPDCHADGELRRVRRAGPAVDRVGGQIEPALLRPFLQGGLGVLRRVRLGDHRVVPGATHEIPRRIETAVQIERTQGGLQRVGQNGGTLGDAGLRLTGRDRKAAARPTVSATPARTGCDTR